MKLWLPLEEASIGVSSVATALIHRRRRARYIHCERETGPEQFVATDVRRMNGGDSCALS